MLIGICGKKSHGKNAVGDYLAERYGYALASYASPLKMSAAAAIGCTVDDLERLKNNPNAKVRLVVEGEFSEYGDVIVTDITVRKYTQYYGDEAHRQVFGEDFWTNIMMSRISNRDGARLAITDTRYDNEADAIRAAGGVVVCVWRPYFTDNDGHASEKIPSSDYLVVNDRGFEELYEEVDRLMNRLGISPR